jgi:hypothetical protein
VPQALETIATAGDASQLGAKSLAHASHHITEAFAMNPALRLITSESFLGLFSLFGLLCSLGVIALAVLSWVECDCRQNASVWDSTVNDIKHLAKA